MSKFVEREQQISDFWEKERVFQKSVEQEAPHGDYVFYDGPPFATGLPHYGHLVASVMKDVVPRYWTMRGHRVERRWGWDCHGLPIENIVEKELGFTSKKDIEAYGIDKFNETCRSKVEYYADEWKKTMKKFGRWADMEQPYFTMDLSYMESVWFVFKQLWGKELVYQDYKSMHVCPRCETTLSQQEVSEGYKDVKDLSVIAEFELVDEPGTYVLAWTTTPWTLPGNVALAVGEGVAYVKVTTENGLFILAKERVEDVFKDSQYEIVGEIAADELIGKAYAPLFPYYAAQENLENKENGWKIYGADFVTTEDGTGVVHIAPAFGQDDMNVGKQYSLPFIQHVTLDGKFTDEVTDFAGMYVKSIDDPMAADVAIIKYLAHNNVLFSKEKFEHSYPHCWRCDTPLLNYATSSWFVKVTAIKDLALTNAKEINWSPAHIKDGRFGKWLEGARDWSISRQRFWASVMPVWQSEDGEYLCVGSVAELEELSGQKVTDLHKHVLDAVTFEKDGKTYKRIPDVLDTWFDSGSMPYAQLHYPFENKEIFEQNFPAEFIAEGVDQTRAWFYYLHVLATAIMEKPAFKNVIVNGIVLAEDGKKMSKKLNNYPDPNIIMETYGADALRFYLLSSPVMEAENLNFVEQGVKEVMQKVNMLLDNVLAFYQLYNGDTKEIAYVPSSDVLDKWIVAKLHELIKEVTEAMNAYSLPKATRPILEFINELSTWYVRRSRDRFKSLDQQAIATLGYVLKELAHVMAPSTPFQAEYVYQQLGFKDSVHLQRWPEYDEALIDQELLASMASARKIVEGGLAARNEAKMKIRQPLQSYTTSVVDALSDELTAIILDELNVKSLNFGKDGLDTKLTKELELEGQARELIRNINLLRKDRGLTIEDRVVIYQQGFDELVASQEDIIITSTLATEIISQQVDDMKEVAGGAIAIKKNN